MKISARNVIKGKVKKVTVGAVNDEVIVELPGGNEIVSIITKSSAESLGLAPGKDVSKSDTSASRSFRAVLAGRPARNFASMEPMHPRLRTQGAISRTTPSSRSSMANRNCFTAVQKPYPLL